MSVKGAHGRDIKTKITPIESCTSCTWLWNVIILIKKIIAGCTGSYHLTFSDDENFVKMTFSGDNVSPKLNILRCYVKRTHLELS